MPEKFDVERFLDQELIASPEVAAILGISEGAARKEMQRHGHHEWRGYSRTVVVLLKRARDARRKNTPPKEK